VRDIALEAGPEGPALRHALDGADLKVRRYGMHSTADLKVRLYGMHSTADLKVRRYGVHSTADLKVRRYVRSAGPLGPAKTWVRRST
jgi:hypothetical protein